MPDPFDPFGLDPSGPGPIAKSLQAHLDDALLAVEPDRTVAVLVAVDAKGVRAVVAKKFGDDHWEFEATGGADFHTHFSGEVLLKGSW